MNPFYDLYDRFDRNFLNFDAQLIEDKRPSEPFSCRNWIWNKKSYISRYFPLMGIATIVVVGNVMWLRKCEKKKKNGGKSIDG